MKKNTTIIELVKILFVTDNLRFKLKLRIFIWANIKHIKSFVILTVVIKLVKIVYFF